ERVCARRRSLGLVHSQNEGSDHLDHLTDAVAPGKAWAAAGRQPSPTADVRLLEPRVQKRLDLVTRPAQRPPREADTRSPSRPNAAALMRPPEAGRAPRPRPRR